MLNFRKLKQDYSPNILKEGKLLFDKNMVLSAKINHLDPQAVRLSCRVMGNYDNTYQCEIEIDRRESSTTNSDCDCPYKYDCQHIAGILYFLEEHFDAILVDYSKEIDISKEDDGNDSKAKKTLRQTIKEAETKESHKRGKKQQKELLQEYISAAQLLALSPFFHASQENILEHVELAVIITHPALQQETLAGPEIQLALRLPYRSKPLHIPNIKEFLDAVSYQEAIYIGSKRYFFNIGSFESESANILKLIVKHARLMEPKEERHLKMASLDVEAFGSILAHAYEIAFLRKETPMQRKSNESSRFSMPCLYNENLEVPLSFSQCPVKLNFEIEYLEVPTPKILLNPTLLVKNDQKIHLEEARFFACDRPGMIFNNVYYPFQPCIRRSHLRSLQAIRNMTIPEPLFGTFVENSLPELVHFAEVSNREAINRFVTLPFVGKLEAECTINYLDGELEASLQFLYDILKIPAVASHISLNDITSFVSEQGILARNLTEEQQIIQDLFQDFTFDNAQGVYISKSEKKIVEFMTDVIPRNQNRVKFICPENLLDHFIYDDTQFILTLKETNRIDFYEVDLIVDGHLNGISMSALWECLATRKTFIELAQRKTVKKRGRQETTGNKLNKILVLDLEKISKIVQIFDEIGINDLSNHTENRPLWSLSSIDPSNFDGLPIQFSMSERLLQIQQQMQGILPITTKEIPNVINATLRPYQSEGIAWLDRLRQMHLNGILADDMGLGKTLQAIIAITQHKEDYPGSVALVVCPTSLVYNWKAEFNKFNADLRALPVDGTPVQRKKLLTSIEEFDVIITSYSLLQKDIEHYREIPFSYVILDEAQHIKNRGTRNAKSVKLIQAKHRLILTGTPIENCLDELWSLFDFLMPGLLSSYDRFVEKFIRNPSTAQGSNLELLRKKVSPFILRRMKKDVLKELPPISEIMYHCHLSDLQRELYHSYAKSAREELSQLVEKEGYNRVQIHVLATLTRLKQICCHPAIFAKEKAEPGDSAKYDMLLELLQTLIAGKHKIVIFSQYTRMLNIMRTDFQKQGINFEYLDGSSKNRLETVNRFNESENIPLFLVSLKAGGTGLNLTGANVIVHYDIWWNPAIEEQATGRIYRLGQENSVLACKLVTLDTIEEKIIKLQDRKKGLVKKVITSDEEAIDKLTWEEIFELLQT